MDNYYIGCFLASILTWHVLLIDFNFILGLCYPTRHLCLQMELYCYANLDFGQVSCCPKQVFSDGAHVCPYGLW